MKTHFSHIVVAISVCLIALIGYGMWYAVISAKSTTIADLQSRIDTKTETVSRIAATRATLAGVTSDEERVQGYFVSEAGVVAFIDALERREKTLGTTVDVLSVSTSGTAAQPSLTLSLTVKGTFDAVMRTVGSIEYAPYDLSISAVFIAQDAENSWRADLKLFVGSLPTVRAATSTP
ncbi:MAG: hypothetical protein Q8P23_03185 [bacterium]|nr:hypothetical protein [bacterium]